LPIVKKLGFAWVGVDDGWQSSDGDWQLVSAKFPNGDADMKALVNTIHAGGFRAQLWWAPLAAKPDSELVKSHPEELLLNADGSKQRISYWNDWYLCPADPAVVEHHRKLVVKMFKEWGYDGLKLDGQHMNAVPPCYNPAHRHARPEDAVEALPRFFQMIYETARSIKPDALVEWCPCGTAFNFYTLPHLNMSVASDPHNSWQVRTKGKTLKALHGDATAYFGDHVELSDQRQDFASTLGIGGVVGTNFTWPPGSSQRNRLDLTPDKEQLFQKWIALYKDKMLSRGEYLGALYDIGFDRPEAHAIRKAGNMYYAFYAPEWKGKIELRGLGRGAYRVSDYENGKDLGAPRPGGHPRGAIREAGTSTGRLPRYRGFKPCVANMTPVCARQHWSRSSSYFRTRKSQARKPTIEACWPGDIPGDCAGFGRCRRPARPCGWAGGIIIPKGIVSGCCCGAGVGFSGRSAVKAPDSAFLRKTSAYSPDCRSCFGVIR
jgi:alpha-galactosidase